MSILAEDNITITSQKTVGDNAAAYTDAAVEGLVPMTGHAEGSIANFEDLLIKDLVTDINPVQDLSGGNPSPTNICPISGSTEANIYRTCENIWDEEWEVGKYNLNTGAKETATGRIRSKNAIPVISGATYYAKTPNILLGFFYDADMSYIGHEIDLAANATFTVPSNACYLAFGLQSAYGTTYNNDICINYPSTDTSYHAYTGDVYTIDLGRTVYKGTLDVTTGLLTVTCESITFDGSSDEGWNGTATDSGTGIRRFYTTKSYAPNYSIVACDSYVIGTSTSAITQQTDGIIIWDSGRVGVSPSWAQGMTLAQFKTGLASQPFQIVKELATPLTYQLTPTQIATLNGTNNVWSNTGNVYVDLVAIRDDSEKLEKVSKLAGDTAQYFWYTSTGTDTGAHITEIPREDFETDPANGGGNLLARSNGIAIRDGLDEVATFSADGITMKDSEQNEIFDVSVRSGNITHILRYGYASSDGYGGVINLGRSIDTFTSLSVTYHPSADPSDVNTLEFYSLPIAIALSDTDLYALYVSQDGSSTLDISFYSKDSDGFGELVCDNITIEYTTTQITSEMNLGAYPDDTLTAPLRVGNGTAANAKSNAFAVDFAGNAYFSGNDIRINCNADSSGGTSLIRGERFNGYYLSESTAFVVIDVYKVGRLVNLLVTCQRTYAVTVGSNFFTGQLPRVPRPAMEIATGAGFYSQSVIGGFVSIDSNDEVAVTVRNVAGQTVSANATVYCTITYVAEE